MRGVSAYYASATAPAATGTSAAIGHPRRSAELSLPVRVINVASGQAARPAAAARAGVAGPKAAAGAGPGQGTGSESGTALTGGSQGPGGGGGATDTEPETGPESQP
jgi:hypothetical protein